MEEAVGECANVYRTVEAVTAAGEPRASSPARSASPEGAALAAEAMRLAEENATLRNLAQQQAALHWPEP